jgi:hypothetical protein
MMDWRFFGTREALVYYLVIAVPLGGLLIFIAAGWPGDPASCVGNPEDPTCYCEKFLVSDVKNHNSGVRQPWNTWGNLYALITGFIVAYCAWKQRRDRHVGDDHNRMRTRNVYALIYIGVVVFLGLGSMWYHASMTHWGGVVDGASMETLTAFIVFYTLVRLFNQDMIFYIGYPAAVVLLTVLHGFSVDSFILIIIQMGIYTVLEIVILFFPHIRSRDGSWDHYLKWWIPGVGSIGLATLFWILSQKAGDPLCFPGGFQFHVIWHLLAGTAATLLYFYWRDTGR